MNVLDASAVLALLQNEPGSENVPLTALLSTVNYAEVVKQLVDKGLPVRGLGEDLTLLGMSIQPFSAEEAQLAGELYSVTKAFGLSLGDRACLAVAKVQGGMAITADKVWEKVEVESGVKVKLIR